VLQAKSSIAIFFVFPITGPKREPFLQNRSPGEKIPKIDLRHFVGG
jgi:hypothetical protein